MTLTLRQRKRGVLSRRLHVVRLLLRRRQVAFLGGRKLLGRGFRGRSARAAVVTDIGRVVHDHGFVVNVSDRRIADVVH
jgi:hypothetical protein